MDNKNRYIAPEAVEAKTSIRVSLLAGSDLPGARPAGTTQYQQTQPGTSPDPNAETIGGGPGGGSGGGSITDAFG